MIKKGLSLIIVFSLILSSFVYAEEPTVISIDDALDMANEDKTNIEKLDDSIEALWKQYNSAITGKNALQTQLDTIKAFEDLYEKKHTENQLLTAEEEAELFQYKMMFGDKPPTYSNQEMLDTFIKGRDFGFYSLYAEIQKLKNTRKGIVPALNSGVKDLYNQVVGLQNTLMLQNEYLEISTTQHEQKIVQYNLGQVSETDLKISELNLEILKKQIEQLAFNLDTLEMNFNQLIDANVTDKFVFVDAIAEYDDILAVEAIHKDLDVYLSDAITNRSETKNARIDLGVKEREENIISIYLSNELLTDRVNASIATTKATYDLEQAEALVKEDISDGYIDALSKWNDYLLSIDSYNLKVKSYEDMKARFDIGQVTETNLKLVEYQMLMSEDTVKTNLRSYLRAVDKLDAASGIGPAY